MLRLLRYYLPYKRLLTLAIVCNILMSLFVVVSIPALLPFLQILFSPPQPPQVEGRPTISLDWESQKTPPHKSDPTELTLTNHSGGIQGGISNGMDIYFRVAFKPVATIMRDQPTLNAEGETVIIKGKGRHDPCVVPRAVVIVEAMTALVLADHVLRMKVNRV